MSTRSVSSRRAPGVSLEASLDASRASSRIRSRVSAVPLQSSFVDEPDALSFTRVPYEPSVLSAQFSDAPSVIAGSVDMLGSNSDSSFMSLHRPRRARLSSTQGDNTSDVGSAVLSSEELPAHHVSVLRVRSSARVCLATLLLLFIDATVAVAWFVRVCSLLQFVWLGVAVEVEWHQV